MDRTTSKSEKLDLRLTPAAKRVLQTAAAVSSRSVSEFVLESALARAAITLHDRTRFGLDAEQWLAFQSALDEPAKSIPALKKLLSEPSVFEQPHTE